MVRADPLYEACMASRRTFESNPDPNPNPNPNCNPNLKPNPDPNQNRAFVNVPLLLVQVRALPFAEAYA